MPENSGRWKRATIFAALSAFASGLLLVLGTASGYLSFTYPSLESRPFESNLVVRFSRLPGGSNTAGIMKLAEGAVFERSLGHSHGGQNQYWITDGKKRFSLVSEAMRSIWETHELNGKNPVSTPLWNEISGSDDAIQALSFLSFMASLDMNYSPSPMAAEYGCFEAELLDSFDCFCPNQALERSAQRLLATEDIYPMCSVDSRDLFPFLLTIASIQNEGSRPIKDLRMSFKDTSQTRTSWVSSPFSIIQECGLEDQLESNTFPTGSLHSCGQEYLKEVNYDMLDAIETHTLEVSSLEPGEEIFILVDVFIPDQEGLPETYIAGHFYIERLDYLEGGQVFSILSPTPLANRRLPIITSPDGGRGGQ